MALHRQFSTHSTWTSADLYLTQFPLANAYAIGTDRPIVVLNSELVRILDVEGRRIVLAHEAAHIQSDHVLYRTALLILLQIGSGARLPLLAGLPLLAIRMALLEWSRAAELSCDRAAALVTRDPQAVCQALMVLAAGEAAEDLNLDAFVAQGMDYEVTGSGLERLTKRMQDLNVTHPMPVRRVRMLLDWVREGDYDRMVRGDYLRRGEEQSARDEADAAGVFYADRVGSALHPRSSSPMSPAARHWRKHPPRRGATAVVDVEVRHLASFRLFRRCRLCSSADTIRPRDSGKRPDFVALRPRQDSSVFPGSGTAPKDGCAQPPACRPPPAGPPSRLAAQFARLDVLTSPPAVGVQAQCGHTRWSFLRVASGPANTTAPSGRSRTRSLRRGDDQVDRADSSSRSKRDAFAVPTLAGDRAVHRARLPAGRAELRARAQVRGRRDASARAVSRSVRREP